MNMVCLSISLGLDLFSQYFVIFSIHILYILHMFCFIRCDYKLYCFYIAVSTGLFLVYKYAIDFSVLILHPEILCFKPTY